MACRFLIWYFFSIALCNSRCTSDSVFSLSLLNYFSSYLSIRPFCYVLSLFPHFTPKLFCFLCIRLLVCTRSFPTNLLVEFSFVILECPDLFLLLDLVSVSFKSLFFRQYLLIYSFKLHHQTCQRFCFVFYPNISLRFFPTLHLRLLS